MQIQTLRRAALFGALLSLVASACGAPQRPTLLDSPPPSQVEAATTTTTQPPPNGLDLAATTTLAPVDSTGKRPIAPIDPIKLAAAILETETEIRDPTVDPVTLAEVSHRQQVAYRYLGSHPELDEAVMAQLPADIAAIATANIEAGREFRSMHSDASISANVPAWEVVAPPPPDELLGFYQEAAAATGIEWEYLAAINLVETRMGRIRGLSTAGAQGPMQFIPTTWDEVGEGDVNDPHDSIQAAARYLVRRGGPDNMDRALLGYNNSEPYVRGVQAYAQIMRDDPRAFYGYYGWQVYFLTQQGSLWLPEGYYQTEALPAAVYLVEHPESG